MNWEEKSLDELGFVSRGRSRHRPRDAEHLYGGIYPFVQTSDVKHAGLYINKFSQTYSEAGLAQSKLWKSGTLCITIAANIADTAILEIDACFPDSIIGFIPEPNKADARFIKYLFDARLQKRFKQFTQGAAQDNLSQSKLLSLKLPVPPIQIQNKIADILSRYDEAIANNCRRIELLERSARLLYKEWFVHLRFPGHEHVAIGSDGIPEGWARKKLEKVGFLNYGKTLKKGDRQGGKYPVFGSGGIIGTHDKFLVEAPGIIVGRKGSIGNVFWTDKNYYPIDTTYFINKEQSSLFLYHSLQNIGFINTDVAVPGLNRDFAHSRELTMPKKQILDLFHEFVDPLYEQISKLNAINQKLQQARDLLLPRLMNGEITV